MAELLKYRYNDSFFKELTDGLNEVLPNFDEKSFLKAIYDNDWNERELKERMYHISKVLHSFLPKDFEEAIAIILKLVNHLKKTRGDSFEYMFLPDFIEKYGQDSYNVSASAFEEVTQFTSCEFAVRPFILRYPEKMMSQMLTWSCHKHPAVRRLSSEGCRPRLPWAMALPLLKKDPGAILPILENLKNDVSEAVRRSVANNLNDISKDNPEVVIKLVHAWKGKTDHTDWVLKHGCRTLLKQGHPEVMEIFGLGSSKGLKIDSFKVLTPKVQIGKDLGFSFVLSNANKTSTKVRLEYGLYYQKANGKLSKKVFNISEKVYEANSRNTITRKQSFKLITTRKFHKGLHQLSIILNGIEQQKLDFNLV